MPLEPQSFIFIGSVVVVQWFSHFFMALPAKALILGDNFKQTHDLLEQHFFTYIARVALEQWFSYFFTTQSAKTLTCDSTLANNVPMEQQTFTFIASVALEQWWSYFFIHDTIG